MGIVRCVFGGIPGLKASILCCFRQYLCAQGVLSVEMMTVKDGGLRRLSDNS